MLARNDEPQDESIFDQLANIFKKEPKQEEEVKLDPVQQFEQIRNLLSDYRDKGLKQTHDQIKEYENSTANPLELKLGEMLNEIDKQKIQIGYLTEDNELLLKINEQQKDVIRKLKEKNNDS